MVGEIQACLIGELPDLWADCTRTTLVRDLEGEKKNRGRVKDVAAYFVDLVLEVGNGSLEGESDGLLWVGERLEAVEVFESAIGNFARGEFLRPWVVLIGTHLALLDLRRD